MLLRFVTLAQKRPLRFMLGGSKATSSATGDYVAVPARFLKNEEPAYSNEERTRKNHSFCPESVISRCGNTSDM